jgi:hypothetical protein
MGSSQRWARLKEIQNEWMRKNPGISWIDPFLRLIHEIPGFFLIH